MVKGFGAYAFVYRDWVRVLIHDVNPSQLSGTCISPSLREALLDAQRDTVTHRATS